MRVGTPRLAGRVCRGMSFTVRLFLLLSAVLFFRWARLTTVERRTIDAPSFYAPSLALTALPLVSAWCLFLVPAPFFPRFSGPEPGQKILGLRGGSHGHLRPAVMLSQCYVPPLAHKVKRRRLDVSEIGSPRNLPHTSLEERRDSLPMCFVNEACMRQPVALGVIAQSHDFLPLKVR